MNKPTAVVQTSWRTDARLYPACLLLMAVIFIIDLQLPLGVAMGVPYIAVVLLSLWSPTPRLTLQVAAISSALTIIAYLYKPPIPDMWKADMNRLLSLSAVWITAALSLQRRRAEEKRMKALEDIRVLRGLLPVCAACKKIRDDQGYWTQMEAYIRDHSEAEFSHGICPECAQKLYPDYYKPESKKNT